MKKKVFLKTVLAFIIVVVVVFFVGCNDNKNTSKPTSAQPEVKLAALFVGDTLPMVPDLSGSGTTVKWSSDNIAVATIGSDGAVKGISAGQCQITYSSSGNQKQIWRVTVLTHAPTYIEENSLKISVVEFHSIMPRPSASLGVPKEDFDAEMKWLHDNGYSSLTMGELYEHLATHTPFPKKSVVITLDDGYADNYYNAYPVLQKYGLHATVFMITGNINKPDYLTSAQIKEISDSGVISVEDHTVTHPKYLNKMSYAAQYKELRDSKDTIEKITGKKVEYIAYPYGCYNADTIKAAQEIGYKMGFQMDSGQGGLINSAYEYPRIFVKRDLKEFIKLVQGS
jgi:peptidoglycan/xylan/chitin deacetylase (PgdA/CDA1 family)